jgi:hypothetical protein
VTAEFTYKILILAHVCEIYLVIDYICRTLEEEKTQHANELENMITKIQVLEEYAPLTIN